MLDCGLIRSWGPESDTFPSTWGLFVAWTCMYDRAVTSRATPEASIFGALSPACPCGLCTRSWIFGSGYCSRGQSFVIGSTRRRFDCGWHCLGCPGGTIAWYWSGRYQDGSWTSYPSAGACENTYAERGDLSSTVASRSCRCLDLETLGYCSLYAVGFCRLFIGF